MDINIGKGIAIIAFFLIPIILGSLPLCLVSKYSLKLGSGPGKRALSYINCFAGGVFLGTCLMSVMSEGREQFEEFKQAANFKESFPFFEAGIGVGFFLVAFVEKLAHRIFTHKKRPHSHNEKRRDQIVSADTTALEVLENRETSKDPRLVLSARSLQTDVTDSNIVPNGNVKLTKYSTASPEYFEGIDLDSQNTEQVSRSRSQIQNGGHYLSLSTGSVPNGDSDALCNCQNMEYESNATSKDDGAHRSSDSCSCTYESYAHQNTKQEHSPQSSQQKQTSMSYADCSQGHYSMVEVDAECPNAITAEIHDDDSGHAVIDVGDGHIHVEFQDGHNGHDHGHSHINQNPSSFRVLLLFLAMSFHTVFDGLAVGLRTDLSSLWSVLGAIAMHKTIVSICLGLELAEVVFGATAAATSTTSTTTTTTSKPKPGCTFRTFSPLLIFAIMAPVGVAIGMAVTSGQVNDHAEMLTGGILQAVATGAFLYVTCFEILGRDMLSGHDGSVSRVMTAVAGYGVMCVTKIWDSD